VTNQPPPGLTQRQTQVWRLRQAGLGQRRIARRLGISKTAVQHHLDTIERKLAERKDEAA
jgi:DNA-binding CsgD family transcriptional regulator